MAILKDLIVHGSSRFLNKIYASEIQTPLIEAEAGIIKKLKADDVTVVGLLDVQGQMHTNSWTNSNIATIDGSFYITPTLSSSSGTVSFSSAAAATFTGTYSAVSSLYIGNNTASTVQWTSGSKILITGEVQVNREWIPLGTLLGTLNSTNPTTSMPVVSITDNRNNISNILTDIYSLKGNASLSYRNLKVSLYQRADSSKYYPLGIFMTALGQNGKTFLDIYGGVNVLTTSYGGYANPNVRIGNLSGLPAITTAAGNFTPVGWGIYTTNGYFSGTIVSNTGVIGGWKLGASSLYNGTTGLNNTTAGIYLGTDGIRNYKDTDTYVNITEGVITAKGVDLSGKITASSGSIAGWRIASSYLASGNSTTPAANVLLLSPNGTSSSYTVAGEAKTGWMITAGTSFGVNKDGGIYATSGKIGGWTIGTSSLYNSKSSYNNSNEGLYLGTDYIAGGAGEEWWFKKDGSAKIGAMTLSAAGVLSVPAANISGILTASQVDVSGIITAGSVVTDTLQGGTFNTTDYIRVSTQASSALTIGTSGSKTDWRILAGKTFGVDKAGNMYATSATISGNITATGGTIGGASITDGVLYITDANISGTISSNHIDASSISIGMNQVTNLSTALEGKQAAGDYATNTALSNVSTTASTALNQSVEYIKGTQTGSGVAAWTGVTTESTLRDGKIIMYYLPVKSAANVTLNLTLADNTTTGAIPVYLNYSTSSNDSALTRVSTHYPAGSVIQMTYDGVANQWKTTGYNTNVNTNTIGTLGATKLKAGTNASNVSATTVYRWTLIMKKTVGSNPTWVSLVTSSSNGTSKTRYTGGLYPDQIFYMSANYSNSPYGYNTGASIGDSYAALGFDLRYSTNCGSTLVIGKPVYLVGEINSLDGLFYLDSTWWTQTEPTMEDGKTYIYLGNAYSTTNVYLVEKNPLMKYYRGAFRTEEEIAGMTATSYITYINANDGIKVHNAQDTFNYLQLNSTAISMYRNRGDGINSDEVLRIDDTGIRVGKNEGPHFLLTNDKLAGYGDVGNVYFEVGKGNDTTIQLFYGNGSRTSFDIGPFFKEIYYVRKGDIDLIEGTDYNIDVTAVRYNIYFETEPSLNSTISVTYKNFYKDFIYTIGSSSSGDITMTSQQGPDGTTIVVKIQTHKSYEAEQVCYKKAGTDYWRWCELGITLGSGTYKYSFQLGDVINSGDQVKLSYNVADHSDLTPDTVTETYTWDTTYQGSTKLTIPSAYQITSVSVNNTILTENEDYVLDGLLKYGYLNLNTALAANEKIEMNFSTEEYNFEYQPTYFNFSNTNLENSVKGIGAASFGSANVNKGVFCLAQGVNNIVTGYASHVEGYENIVTGSHSHAGGTNSFALAQNSFVHGDNLQATYLNSAAFGHYNSPDNQLFSIGKGGYENAFSINQDGDIQIGGCLLAGTTYVDKKPLFKIVERTHTGIGMGQNGGFSITRDISLEGYKPIGVLGLSVVNSPGHPTSTEADASYCVIPRFWLGYNYTNDHPNYKTDSIYYYIWNLNTSRRVDVQINMRILYIAETAISSLS